MAEVAAAAVAISTSVGAAEVAVSNSSRRNGFAGLGGLRGRFFLFL